MGEMGPQALTYAIGDFLAQATAKASSFPNRCVYQGVPASTRSPMENHRWSEG